MELLKFGFKTANRRTLPYRMREEIPEFDARNSNIYKFLPVASFGFSTPASSKAF
jgi:hypothetical protein